MKLPGFLSVGALVFTSWTLAAAPAFAHPGGLNAEGCHNNRKTGDYHCHRTASSAKRTYGVTPGSAGAFRNCAQARAAGAAPVYRGDPGYGTHLDRDNDGIGCEPYRGR
jgi:hypothetical protein